MPIPKKDLRRRLIKKFHFQQVSGSRHEAVALFVDGRKVATTRFSRSGKDVSDKILSLIARQIRVNLGYLKQMHGCTKGSDDYMDHLRKTGYIP